MYRFAYCMPHAPGLHPEPQAVWRGFRPKLSHRSAAFRRSCRRRKNAQIDQNADRSPLSSNWSRSTASALMSAATRRRWTQTRMSPCVERQLVATGRNSRTRSTLRNSTPTRRRSVAVRRQSAHVASDPAADWSASVAARGR